MALTLNGQAQVSEHPSMPRYFALLKAGEWVQAHAMRAEPAGCKGHEHAPDAAAFAAHFQNMVARYGPFAGGQMQSYRLDKPERSGHYFRQFYGYALTFGTHKIMVTYEFGPGPNDAPQLKCGYSADADGKPW